MITDKKPTVSSELVSNLVPYNRNAKKHNKTQINNVAKSISEFGMVQPIVIDKDNNVIIGHCRLEACKKLKIEEVPVVKLEDLTPEQANKLRLLDNKLNESEWDFDLLVEDIPEIDFNGYDLDWNLPEVKDDTEVEEDEAPENVETRCKLGDIWQLGQHRLICGDSTDVNVINKLMDNEVADMIFTDPPYNVAFNGRSGKFDVIENDNISEADFNDLITASCDIIRMLNPKAYYIWCNWKFYGILQEQLEYKSCIVWAKNVFGMGKGYRHQHEFCLFNGNIDDGINNESDLWEIAKDTKYVHPTQKPVALCARALKNHKVCTNIVDLFGGSGSTLMACEQLNRKCFMCELDPHYCDVIIQRWENFTHEKATLISE